MNRNKVILTGYRSLLGLVSAAALIPLLSGCKTKPAADSGFLESSSNMTHNERFPFQRVWVKPGINKNDYSSIVVSPVNTAYLMDVKGWKAVNPGNVTLEKSAQDLAEYTRSEFIEAFTEDKGQRLKVVDRPGAGTLILDLAIVELVPSKAVLNAVAIAAPMEASLPASFAAGKSSVAIEGRVRDSQTGETLMTFADREEPPKRPVDLRSITWWYQAKDSIDTWARQMVKLANTPPTDTVKDERFFKLSPW